MQRELEILSLARMALCAFISPRYSHCVSFLDALKSGAVIVRFVSWAQVPT